MLWWLPTRRVASLALSCTGTRRPLAIGSSCQDVHRLPTPRISSSADLLDDKLKDAVRSWLVHFKSTSIPRNAVELTFSRSSGPGGQNVNKVNTKATLRCPVDSHWIPTWATLALKKTPFYVTSTNTLLITSTVHRSQSQNIDDCLSKLHALIVSASSAFIKNEPSEGQKKRIAAFVRAEKANRRIAKSKRSLVKKSRKSTGAWD